MKRNKYTGKFHNKLKIEKIDRRGQRAKDEVGKTPG